MISRVAEHCFWFGRYLERTESTARVVQVTRALALDSDLPKRACWAPVVIVAGEHERFAATHDEAAEHDGDVVQKFMVWDEKNGSSLVRSAGAARENARAIRDVLSREVWETVNWLHVWLPEGGKDRFKKDKESFYRKVREATQLCLGQLRSTMLHDAALDYVWLGVLLERVGQTARMCDVHHHALALEAPGNNVLETSVWLTLLRACSGLEPFMRRNQARVTGEAIAAFLLLEGRFPRSVRYCVRSATERLAEIRPPAEDLPGEKAWRRLRQLDEWLAQLVPAAVARTTHDVLTHVVEETAAVCDDLHAELFAPAPAATTPPAPEA